jgi:hypothetical protein
MPAAVPDILISGFNEDPPIYRGGIWLLRDDQLVEIYRGFGIFGMAAIDGEHVIAATRVADPPLIAFRKEGESFRRVPVLLRDYIPTRRAHGIAVHARRLFLVAAQGEEGGAMCSNTDIWANHGVSKVLISELSLAGPYVEVARSRIWNPYECDHHHHYNDLLVDDESVHLVSFSTCTPQKEYVDRGSVSRFRHDGQLDLIVTDRLEAPHSAAMHEDRLYVCSSRDWSLVSVPPSGGEEPRIEHRSIRNFVRGLVVTDDFYWIGLSRSSGRTNSAHLSDSMNGVLRVDRRTGESVRVPLPDDCDNTYTILPLRPVESGPVQPESSGSQQ